MSLENYQRLNSALQSFVEEYVQNPVKYLYEADVQVTLSNHLEEVFCEPHIINAQREINKGQKFDIGKVHREYPHNVLTKPIDLVVFGEPRQYTEEELESFGHYENFYTQPIKFAIELKLVFLNEPRNYALDISIEDYSRFVQHKLPILQDKYRFEYGLQLTVFNHLLNMTIVF